MQSSQIDDPGVKRHVDGHRGFNDIGAATEINCGS